jgi:ribosomal-protein-serine acetyltransferase
MEHSIAGTLDQLMIPVDNEIELRLVTPADCAELYSAIDRNRSRLGRWLPWVGFNFQERDLMTFLEEKQRDNASRHSLTTTIWFHGELCGSIGLHEIDPRHRNTSIGYWLDAAYEGKGIMTRVCRAIVSHGFCQYGLHRIEIRCATGNSRSIAIARRLKFVEEGILREAEWLSDRWVDLRVFSMLAQDWKPAPPATD